MTGRAWVIACSLAVGGVCVAGDLPGQTVAGHVIGLPSIQGPIPQTATSHAFNSAAHSQTPIDLSSAGYLEEEYFQRGTATVYDWPAVGHLTSLGSGPYVTRILVRRPKDPRRFNGAVIVEPLNSSHMLDADLMWVFSHGYLMSQGYVWIGLTVKPVSVAALQRFDPGRYAPLSFASPLPETRRCTDLELGPEDRSTEMGLAFDALSQLGALVHSDSPQNPLQRYAVERVYMTGYSQTAGYTRTYANAIAPFVTREGGQRMYDGYLEGGHGPFNVVLNTCSKPFSPEDPRLRISPPGVPFVAIAGEGDALVTEFMRRPDGDRPPDLARRYEVAGATHSGSWLEAFAPKATDLRRAGGGWTTSVVGCVPDTPQLSGFPLRYVMDALWQNLDQWVTQGIPPPPSDNLKLTRGRNGLVTVKDSYGNALGGLRTPAVDVPIATWHSSRGGLERCMRVGYSTVLSASQLHALYPTHADYVRKVNDDVRKLLADRWLTPPDAQEILSEAKRAVIP